MLIGINVDAVEEEENIDGLDEPAEPVKEKQINLKSEQKFLIEHRYVLYYVIILLQLSLACHSW